MHMHVVGEQRDSQVQPPLRKREVVSLFLSTTSPFYEYLVRAVTTDFPAFIQVEQRVEHVIRDMEKSLITANSNFKIDQGFLKKHE